MAWTVTVRVGSRVERERFDDLAQALEAIEARGRELERTGPRETVNLRVRRFDPAQQVIARIELSGPERFIANVNGGVDLRGDGAVEAFEGRVRRRVIEQRKGESAYAALRRALSPG